MDTKQNIGASIKYASSISVLLRALKNQRVTKINKILKVIDPMDRIFVTYEIAEQLSIKGFREPCFVYYNDDKILNSHSSSPLDKCDYNSEPEQEDAEEPISAPMWQQVIDWFRRNHRIMICLDFYADGSFIEYHYKVSEPNTWKDCDIFVESGFETYEEARKVAIEKSLTLIK